MGVVSVKEIWSGRTGSIDDRYRRKYVRTFRVITDAMHIGPLLPSQSIGIAVEDAYQDQAGYFDTGVACKNIEAKQTDDPFTWIVTATFDAERSDPEKQSSPDRPKPTDRRPVITWSLDHYQKPAVLDINGKAILNSAKEQFDPPPEIDDAWPKLVIQRNEATFDQGVAFAYRNAINSDPFFGGEPGTWKCFGITATSQYENGQQFWSVTYEFHYKMIVIDGITFGWELMVIDAGQRELKGAPKEYVVITDKNGQPVGRDVPLDGNGQKIDFNITGAKPIPLFWQVYPKLPFAPLNLP